MKVGLISPPWLPVPPPSYGGTESFLDRLALGLQRAGHDVLLFATGDSTVGVPTAYAFDAAVTDRWEDATVELMHAAAAYDALADRDVIHDNTLGGPAWALAIGRPNVVTTCHGRLDGELRGVYRAYGERLSVIAISRSQAALAPEIPIRRVIHHGVDVDAFPVGAGDGGYLLFLGRMCADKGAQAAVQVARELGMPLRIAAKMRDPLEREYFEQKVEPLLGGDIVYIGEVGGPEKLELLGGASALLNPIDWPEPFGLVMIEALACGTPVVARPVGAAPEIIDHGITGFLCTDRKSFTDAVTRVGTLDRAACRDAVARRFSADLMVERHVELYAEVAGG